MSRTLIELLLKQTERHPSFGYTFLEDGETPERQLTFVQLERRARAIGTALTSMGLAGERVLLLYAPGLDFIEAFWGCLFAGTTAVPVYPPDPSRLERSMARLLSIVQDCNASAILTSSALLAFKDSMPGDWRNLPEMRWLATDQVDSALADSWRSPDASGETIALLQYTSGSTATPKGVMLSHGNLLSNLESACKWFGVTSEEDRVVCWLPQYHDMGLIGGILDPVFIGCPVAVLSPFSFLQRPARWLEAITRFQATVSGGPSFGFDLAARKISEEDRAKLDLRSWAVAFNGAEPIRKDVIDRFSRTFAPCGFRAEALYPCYGLAEATLFVTGGRRLELHVSESIDSVALERGRVEVALESEDTSKVLVSSGAILPETEVVIVDPETRKACDADRVGEIWVRGPGVAQGYWNKPDETRETFMARLEPSGDGPFLRTGDLGFTRNGQLFVTGRSKDLIIINGRNLYPHDLELTAERAHPAVRPGGCAAFSNEVNGVEQLLVVAEVRRDAQTLEGITAAIGHAVWTEHGVPVHTIALLPAGGLFKTSSGKTQRRQVKAALLDKTLSCLHTEVRGARPAVETTETNGGLYRDRPKALDDRKTNYQFALDEIPWNKSGSEGAFVGDKLLRAFGMADSAPARDSSAYEFFQWTYAVAMCDHLIFLEGELVRFAHEEKTSLGDSRSMSLFVEEENKHIEMFRRFKYHLGARRPDAAARLDTLSAEWNRGFVWRTPEYRGKLDEKPAHFFTWLGAMLFEEYTITLADLLEADQSSIQPTWLSINLLHAQEERQHLATDLGYLRALKLSDEERWGWSAIFLTHVLGNLSGLKAFEPVWRLCAETYPAEKAFSATLLAVLDERTLWRSMLELFRDSKVFPRTERCLPALDFCLKHASWVESVVWGDALPTGSDAPSAAEEARFRDWLGRSPFDFRTQKGQAGAVTSSAAEAPDARAVEAWLSDWVQNTAQSPVVDVQASFASYGLTSVQAVELSASLGDFIGRPLETTIAWRYPSIEKIVSHVCSSSHVHRAASIPPPAIRDASVRPGSMPPPATRHTSVRPGSMPPPAIREASARSGSVPPPANRRPSVRPPSLQPASTGVDLDAMAETELSLVLEQELARSRRHRP